MKPLVIVGIAGVLSGTACRSTSTTPKYPVPGGSPDRGAVVLQTHGCVSCHTIPGVKYGDGKVAPPLTDFGDRGFIAGVVPNRPTHLIQWILNPQSVKAATTMPDMDLTQQEARDVAAYLYTLR